MGELRKSRDNHIIHPTATLETNTSASMFSSKSPPQSRQQPDLESPATEQICQQLQGKKTRSSEDQWFLWGGIYTSWLMRAKIQQNSVLKQPLDQDDTMLLKGHVSSLASTPNRVCCIWRFFKRTYSGPEELLTRPKMCWILWMNPSNRPDYSEYAGCIELAPCRVAAFVYTQALWHHLSAVWCLKFTLSSMSPKAQDVNSNSSSYPFLSSCQING